MATRSTMLVLLTFSCSTASSSRHLVCSLHDSSEIVGAWTMIPRSVCSRREMAGEIDICSWVSLQALWRRLQGSARPQLEEQRSASRLEICAYGATTSSRIRPAAQVNYHSRDGRKDGARGCRNPFRLGDGGETVWCPGRSGPPVYCQLVERHQFFTV